MSENRLFDYLYEQQRNYPQEKAFGSKVDGRWEYMSTDRVVELGNLMSVGLLQLGLRPGDKVATVVYKTSPEWVILDFAMLQLGILHVPMYPTISAREYEYILKESEAQYCFVGDGDLYEKVLQARATVPGLKEIFGFTDRPGVRRWDSLFSEAASAKSSDDSESSGDFAKVERIKATIRPDDVCTLIYTSGTTGNPKGVMLTHRNITFNVESIKKLVPLAQGNRVLSFLPVSHIFERAAIYFYALAGFSVSFTGTDNLGGDDGDLKAICPHFFTCVPRLLEKVYDRIYAKGLELTGLKRALFFWALKLTDAWEFDQKYSLWKALQWKIAHRLIFSKWREALGGCIKGIITGASACPVKIMRVFKGAGIPIREGYGLTEASPGISFSRYEPHAAMLGTVGVVLEGIDLRLEESPESRPGEGEILVKGAGVMVGYYKQPEKTAEVIRIIDGDRWLVTGDIGTLVEGKAGYKFLKITDRKKELLKTSLGKYIAPSPIESVFKEHRLVDQAMIVGENLKFVSALLVPSAEGLKEWAQKHGIAWTTLPEMIRSPQVLERYQMLVDRVNPFFSHAEQVKKFTLLPNTWEAVRTDGTDSELTPTLKLKRRVIMQKYAGEIEEMYD